MISLSRKLDYALISLAHMLDQPGQLVSARAIALRHGLPRPLLMNILKRLHQRGVLESTRGVKGGYRIAVNLDDLSLARLIAIVDGQVEATAPARRLSMLPPVQGLQYRLMRFLQELKVTDLVKPGRRIDVPLELVGVCNGRPVEARC